MFAAGTEGSAKSAGSAESAGSTCRWQEIAVSSESHLCTSTINYNHIIDGYNYFIDKYNHVIDEYNDNNNDNANDNDHKIYLF